ncbi:PIS1 [Symbiodinium sp. CCMP2456]|nr:PIS1 [Symbiodinium sp. CCMP2456]
MQVKEIFYVANIIDYGRILTLYWAVRAPDGATFALYYSVSYLLDCIDGYAARALNQESRLGYYLDMVIDRVSSCLCLHFAAKSVLEGRTCFGASAAPIVAAILRSLIVLVEIVAHVSVMFLSEVLGVHQKQMGYDYTIVRKYLSDKRYLFWSCLSFELFGLSLIVNATPVVLISLPGFIFRAAANICRLISILTRKESRRWTEEEDDRQSSREKVRRGSSDRLGNHRAASPEGAQVVRRKRSNESTQAAEQEPAEPAQ